MTIAVGTVRLSLFSRAFALFFLLIFFFIFFNCSDPRRLFSSEETLRERTDIYCFSGKKNSKARLPFFWLMVG